MLLAFAEHRLGKRSQTVPISGSRAAARTALLHEAFYELREDFRSCGRNGSELWSACRHLLGTFFSCVRGFDSIS